MKDSEQIRAVDAAWMSLVGVVATSANASSDELQQAVHRVEQARAKADLLPLEDIADAGLFVLQ